jgi:hypothetical protein
MSQSVPAWLDDGTTLATAPASRSQRRAAVTFCVLFTLATVPLIPLATHIHAPVPAFVPIYQTTVIGTYALTTYLLFSHFRRTRVVSLLWVGAGTTAVILFLQLLSFPNRFCQLSGQVEQVPD